MNGVVALVCSETARARRHSSSDTFCGEKAGRDRGSGGVGGVESRDREKKDDGEKMDGLGAGVTAAEGVVSA